MHSATDAADPLTSSPLTMGFGESIPSATRTMLTSDPLADNPCASPALKVASPHGVGGKGVRIPKLGVELRSGTAWPAKDEKRYGAFKVVLTGRCHRSVRRERLLGENSGGQLPQSRTGWVPNSLEVTTFALPDVDHSHC